MPQDFAFEDSAIPDADRSIHELEERYFIDVVKRDCELALNGAESLLLVAKVQLDEVSRSLHEKVRYPTKAIYSTSLSVSTHELILL